MNETPFPKLVRDFKIFEIFEGTNQIQREQISLQLIKEFGKGGWINAGIAEMEEAIAASPLCGAEYPAQMRRLFGAFLECSLANKESKISSDQYNRFILADVLIDLETAHAMCKATSRLKEEDPNDYYNLCARIYAGEAALRTSYRLKRLALGTGGASFLSAVEEKVHLSSIDRYGEALLNDRKALGGWLEENRLS